MTGNTRTNSTSTERRVVFTVMSYKVAKHIINIRLIFSDWFFNAYDVVTSTSRTSYAQHI